MVISFNRQDFDHLDKNTQKYLQPHELNYQYYEDGLPNGNSVGPLTPGKDFIRINISESAK